MKRIAVAGVVGGLVLFLWGALSHMVLPLGRMGLKMLPQEPAVLSALTASIHESGLYFFPGMDMEHEASPAEQEAWNARYAKGPIGLLVYQAEGMQALSMRQLGVELLSNILAALVVAWIVAQAASPSYGVRALSIALMGLFAWLSLSVSYWNWYRFPSAFILAEGIDQVVGWFLGGLVIAALVRPALVRPSSDQPRLDRQRA